MKWKNRKVRYLLGVKKMLSFLHGVDGKLRRKSLFDERQGDLKCQMPALISDAAKWNIVSAWSQGDFLAGKQPY